MSVLLSYNGALERAWYFPFPQRMDKSPLGEELRELLLNILLLCCRVLLPSILSTLHNIGLLSHHYSLYGTLYIAYLAFTMELPLAQMVKTLPTMQKTRVWSEKIPWRRKWQPTPGFLPEKSHGQRSLAGYIQSMGLQSWTHRGNNKQSTFIICKLWYVCLCTYCLCLPPKHKLHEARNHVCLFITLFPVFGTQ